MSTENQNKPAWKRIFDACDKLTVLDQSRLHVRCFGELMAAGYRTDDPRTPDQICQRVIALMNEPEMVKNYPEISEALNA